MPSPFYTPGPDIFGGGLQARREAQTDFASRLGQLYAGGDQKAGQVLGGIAPDKLDAIRSALEKMPATEQAKAKSRVDMLKKWIFTISQTQDEPTRALLWNQMIAQAHQSGADISNIQPNYSESALREAQVGINSIDELMSVAKESRLAESAGGNGTEGERRDKQLAQGDPSSTEWQTMYLNRYMTPQRVGFNPVTGQAISEYIPAPYEVAKKALSVGLGLNQPSKQVYDAFNARQTTVATDGTPAPAPAAATAAPAVAAGEITAPGSVINGTPIPQPAPVVPTTSVSGPRPGMSRAEQERIDAENRLKEREAAAGTQYSADQQKAAGFAARMDQATSALAKNPNFVPNEKDILTYKSDMLRRLTSDEYKLYRQAQENWISANLRRESGAVIGVEEMDQEIKKYFPSPGDSEDVIKQKAESRRIAQEGMKQSAGGAYGQLKATVGKGAPKDSGHPADIQAILNKHRSK